MSSGFGSLPSFASGGEQSGLSPELRAWLQSRDATATAIPPEVDGALAQRGLPSMSSVINGMVNGATGDAQAVGGMGSRIGSMLGDMVGRTGDLIGKFRDGAISPSEFLSAAAGRAKDAAAAAITAPRDAYTGDLQVFGPDGHPTGEAMDRANGMAGLAMTGGFGANVLPRGASDLVSRSVPVYDPVPRAARPFEADYPVARWPDGPPADASGRLTRDIDGRPLNSSALVVGRGLASGADEAATAEKLDAIAASVLGNHPLGVAPGTLGRKTVGLFRTGHDPQTGEAAYGILFDNSLSSAGQDAVIAHELGHGLNRLAGGIPQDGIKSDLARLYNELNNPTLRGRSDLTAESLSGELAKGTNRRNFRPDAFGYSAEEAPAELMAEAMRGYLADPKAMKDAYPKVAARIRQAVNENPSISPHVQFNTGGPGGAAGLPAFAAQAASPTTDQKGAPMAAGFGQLPSFADLSVDDMAALLQRLQQSPQDPRSSGQQPNTQGVPPEAAGLGGLLSPGLGAPPVAMNEGQTQALERAQAGPQDLAALGGSPVDRLLFDRSGMGGGANQFVRGPGQVGAPGFPDTGPIDQRDPSAARAVPLPPARPSDDALAVQPTATGSVSGMNPGGPQRQIVASSGYHPDAPGSGPRGENNMPIGGRPGAAGDFRGQAGDFDPLTGTVISGTPRPIGGQQASAAPSGGVPSTVPQAGQGGPQQSMLERYARGIGNPELSNLLLNVGIGLLTNRGIGAGIGAGLQGYQQSRMGDVKSQLEQYKFLQEQQGKQAQLNYLTKTKGYSPEAAAAMVANPTLLTNQFSQETRAPNTVELGGVRYLVPPNAANDPSQWQRVGPVNGPQPGFEADPNNPGGQRPITGSSADPAYKGSVAGAEAKAKSEAVPDAPIQMRPGAVLLDPNTHQPLYTAPGNQPEGFQTEEKLRGDFNKQISTFTQVHDGYGRVIAATRQREANPGTPSPASDIGLIFGYMKMLDPGSVVREGEYATAKNATGVPERVLNAYNKALNGEFLSDAQRKDFLGQAAELYGTARKTAEGVADRYRGLATQYGVSPDRSVYLPEVPTPPRIGQPSPQATPDIPQGAPAGTRRAPDGNLYAPDPARPGKYLQVR